MRWKENIIFDVSDHRTLLCLEQRKQEVKESDQYLVELLRRGVHEEKELSERIMEHEQTNEMVAGFILAQFLLTYQDFIEDDNLSHEIIP